FLLLSSPRQRTDREFRFPSDAEYRRHGLFQHSAPEVSPAPSFRFSRVISYVQVNISRFEVFARLPPNYLERPYGSPGRNQPMSNPIKLQPIRFTGNSQKEVNRFCVFHPIINIGQ